MALCYKKLWKQLIDHDMTRSGLRDAIGISTATLAKMNKGERIGMPILERICQELKCNIGDLVDYVPNEDAQSSNEGAGANLVITGCSEKIK